MFKNKPIKEEEYISVLDAIRSQLGKPTCTSEVPSMPKSEVPSMPTILTLILNTINLQNEFTTEALNQKDLPALMVGDFMTTLNNRMDKHNITQHAQTPTYTVLNTDSEAYLLANLQEPQIIKAIIKGLIQKLKTGDKVSEIIFNGCSTRDMCGLCCTNMCMLLYLAVIQTQKRKIILF